VRILVVGMSNSIHTARWLAQLDGTGWDVHLFPSLELSVHPAIHDVHVHDLGYSRLAGRDALAPEGSVGWTRAKAVQEASQFLSKAVERRRPGWRARWLAKTIESLRPDVVHSLEIQHAGYLVHDALSGLAGARPRWMVSNWGSDIYLFGRLAEHRHRITQVLRACDFYLCECRRDVALAEGLGLEYGKVLGVIPNAGGLDLTAICTLATDPTSERRVILVKGYQDWAGRSLVALAALAMSADALRGYRVAVNLASKDVELAAQLLAANSGLEVEMIPRCSHEEMLEWYGRARIYIGLSISDAISTSLTEAMALGAFPIQSCTACADEWLDDGVGGFIVPPEDPRSVAEAIQKAVADDELVDNAARENWKTVEARLSSVGVRDQVLTAYRRVMERTK
jgi:glycosyltransferase involved in cell wall biosynthesis